jgi:phosphatidate phosphatase PAH1
MARISDLNAYNDFRRIDSLSDSIQIVSNDFCVGGYQFSSAELYKATFEKIKSDTRENFVSNIVDYLNANGEVFVKNEVENFIDVGTAEDWFDYNNKPTYFCDIDGTIIKSAEIYSLDVEPLTNNVTKLLKEAERGCKLVFCTARSKKYEELTKDILEQLGFKNFELIMEVHHSHHHAGHAKKKFQEYITEFLMLF